MNLIGGVTIIIIVLAGTLLMYCSPIVRYSIQNFNIIQTDFSPYGNNDDKNHTHYDIANVTPDIIKGSEIKREPCT